MITSCMTLDTSLLNCFKWPTGPIIFFAVELNDLNSRMEFSVNCIILLKFLRCYLCEERRIICNAALSFSFRRNLMQLYANYRSAYMWDKEAPGLQPNRLQLQQAPFLLSAACIHQSIFNLSRCSANEFGFGWLKSWTWKGTEHT